MAVPQVTVVEQPSTAFRGRFLFHGEVSSRSYETKMALLGPKCKKMLSACF